MIRITSKREGFRRLGIAHSRTPVDYPDDRFTFEELEKLADEPMLTVTAIDNPPDQESEAKAKVEAEAKAKTEASAKEKPELTVVSGDGTGEKLPPVSDKERTSTPNQGTAKAAKPAGKKAGR